MDSIKNSIKSIDAKISQSTFGRVFRLDGSGHVTFILLQLAISLTPSSQRRGKAQSSALRFELGWLPSSPCHILLLLMWVCPSELSIFSDSNRRRSWLKVGELVCAPILMTRRVRTTRNTRNV